MKRARRIWVFALLALLWSAFVPQVEAAWRCEGRTCATTLFYCCCNQPGGSQDANCGSVTQPTSGPRESACPADCNCVLTLGAAQPAQHRYTSLSGPHLPVALLPHAPSALGARPGGGVSRGAETRGPPLPALCLALPVLRGPPVLTSPFIGS